MAQSLIMPRSEVARGHRHEHDLPWTVVFWVAVGMTVLGLIDIAFLWAPLRIDESVWRFNVIAATIDALPLATIGLTAWLVASAQRHAHGGLTCVTLIGAATFALVLVLVAWFVASALRAQPSGGQNTPAQVEVLRTAFFGLIYLFVYALITGSAAQRMLKKNEHSPAV